MAQFAWTLRQEPTIEAIRVSIDGEPVPSATGRSLYSVDDGARCTTRPGSESSPLLYGLRDGLMVVRVSPTRWRRSTGRWAPRELGVRVARRRPGRHHRRRRRRATAHQALAASVDGTAAAGSREVARDAANLLRPAWDFADRLWLVDRTAGGARGVLRRGRQARRDLEVPGVTGNRRCRTFLVSRDGTRLVAVVRRGHRATQLVVSRIQHTRPGRVIGATPAPRRSAAGGRAQPADPRIAWTSPDHPRRPRTGRRPDPRSRTVVGRRFAVGCGRPADPAVRPGAARWPGSPVPTSRLYGRAPTSGRRRPDPRRRGPRRDRPGRHVHRLRRLTSTAAASRGLSRRARCCWHRHAP